MKRRTIRRIRTAIAIAVVSLLCGAEGMLMVMYFFGPTNQTTNQTINIYPIQEVEKKETTIAVVEPLRYYLSESELDLFEKIVYAESGCGGYESMVSTAAVILNRMDVTGLSLYDIVFAPGQFEPAQDGDIYTGREENRTLVTKEMIRGEGSRAKEAVWAALSGEDPTKEALMAMGEEGGALYFYQAEALSDAELQLRQSIKNYVKIGTEIYYRTWD